MTTVTKIIMTNCLVAVLAISAFAWFSLNRFHAAEVREENQNLEKCLLAFRELLRHKGEGFRIANGRLLADSYVINGNFEVPDKIQEIFGGVATVFMGDTRVSTNVLHDNGERAVGTRLVGPAYDAVFREGKAYRGEALILGVPYLTAYDPIRDGRGEVIGALFVGIKKSEFLSRFNGLKMQLLLTLLYVLTVITTLMVLLGKVSATFEKTKADHLAFLQTLLDTIPSPIFYKDAAGRYLGCNKIYESCVGLRHDELVGKTVHELWAKEQADVYLRKDRELFENRGVQVYEGLVRYSDGTLHDVVFNKAVFQGNDGSLGGLVGVMLDVTERKRAEEERGRLEAQLHHSRLMETVMVKVGHDLKTPLTPLFVLLPLIRSRVSDPGLQRMLDMCCKNAGQINDLTDKALKLAGLQAAVIPAERGNIPLAAALDTLLTGSAAMADGNVTCENAVDPRIMVQVEPEQLTELLANLISNAVRYSPAGGVIRIAAEETEQTVTVSVRDEGIGLSPEHLERIFDEFFKVDESRHDLAAPGLGLSICKRIVLNHNGRIWAESPGTGKGTTILFTLPRWAA